MYDDWQLPPPQEEVSYDTSDIQAAIRMAEGEIWELDDDLPVMEPFDPFADDPE